MNSLIDKLEALKDDNDLHGRNMAVDAAIAIVSQHNAVKSADLAPHDEELGSPVKYSDGSYSREYEDHAKNQLGEASPLARAYKNGFDHGLLAAPKRDQQSSQTMTLLADDKANVWRDEYGDIWEPIRAKATHQPDELACLKAAEESLFHHGYNPATNRDVARICFTAMRSQLKREIVSLDKCAEAVKQVFDLSLEGPDAGFKPDDIAEAVLKAAGAQWRRGTDAE